jgi:capsular exopolysaccharide synthesis family protein
MVLLTAVIAAAAAAVYSLAQTPVYKAVTTLSFSNQFFPPGQQEPVEGQATTSAIAAGSKLVTRDGVLSATSESLGGEPTPDELRSDTTVAIEPTTNLVNVEVRADDGDEAAEIASELAKQTRNVGTDETRAYYRRIAGIAGNKNLKVLATSAEPVAIVQDPEVPTSPASPKPLRNTLIAGFLGLLLGVGIAFLRHALDRRVTDAHEIQRELGLPMVGYVHTDNLGVGTSQNGAVIAADDDLEAFRILRANVDFLGGGEGLRTVAVTSPLPEEGKSTVSAGYAYANALAGRRTLLVECDFRRPVLAERFGFEPSPGLSDHLLGEASPREVLRSIDIEGPSAEPLPVIPAGVDVLQPAELIASPQFHHFLAQIAKAYEIVVVDCAPVLPVGDALELLPQVDGVLLCVRIGQTTREQAMSAKEAMAHLPDKPTGLVITGLERGGEGDYYGYYSSHASAAGEVSAAE